MQLGHCIKLARNYMLAVNVLFMLSGLAISGAALYGLSKADSLEQEVPLVKADSLRVVCLAAGLFGVFIIIASCCGFIGAFKRVNGCLKLNILALVLGICSLVMGAFVMGTGYGVDDVVSDNWTSSHRDAICDYQDMLDCCGYSTALPQTFNCSSCAQHPVTAPNPSCKAATDEWIEQQFFPVVVAFSVLAMVQLVALASACLLCCSPRDPYHRNSEMVFSRGSLFYNPEYAEYVKDPRQYHEHQAERERKKKQKKRKKKKKKKRQRGVDPDEFTAGGSDGDDNTHVHGHRGSVLQMGEV